jgi:hypothetical protein
MDGSLDTEPKVLSSGAGYSIEFRHTHGNPDTNLAGSDPDHPRTATR